MRRIGYVFLVLSLMLALAGCGDGTMDEMPQTQSPPAQTQQSIPSSSQPSTPTPSKPKKELPELMERINDLVVLTFDQANAFYGFLDTQQAEYELFDLYDVEIALQTWTQLPGYEAKGAGILQNGTLNKEAFRQQVKKNNSDFLSSAGGNKHEALPDSDFAQIFEIVCRGVEALLQTSCDQVLLDEKLGDLKILATSMPANGVMTHQDTILAINLKSVEAFSQSSGEADKFEGTILHEAMHLGQVSSDTERESKGIMVRVGPGMQLEEAGPHELFWEWYVEGSAEYLKMDIMQTKEPSVYESYVRELNAMAVALLPTYEPEAVYEQTLNGDLNSFFALFGADTPEKQAEIVTMMCAMDVAWAQPEDFFLAYKEKNGKVVEDRMNYLDRQAGAANLTLTKVFYRQLCDLAVQGVSPAELFSLITAYETEMSRVVRYQNNAERNRPFIDGYNQIQTAFWEQLAGCMGMTAEEVGDQYLAWYYGKTGRELIETPGLGSGRQEWLQERMERNAEQFTKQKAICEFAK